MRNVLFVNCCMRKDSRTETLSRAYLAEIKKEAGYELQEVKLADLDIRPFDGAALELRDQDIAGGALDADRYQLAYDFAAADAIVIAAPFWDASFPAKLKVYIEHICVHNITFAYTSDGKPAKKCRADRLVYITTAGGYMRKDPSVRIYMEELCNMFGIGDVRFYAAQALDIFSDKVEQILAETLDEMLAGGKTEICPQAVRTLG